MGCLHPGLPQLPRAIARAVLGSFLWVLCRFMGFTCQVALPWGGTIPLSLWLQTGPSQDHLRQRGGPAGLREGDPTLRRCVSLLPSPFSPHADSRQHVRKKKIPVPSINSDDNLVRGRE